MATTETVLDHHLDAFVGCDLEAVMEDYDEESTVVTNMGRFDGLEEIEGLFADLFEEFDHPEAAVDMQQQTVDGEFAYIVWTAETPEHSYELATDTFHVPDETIEFQTFAGKVEPK